MFLEPKCCFNLVVWEIYLFFCVLLMSEKSMFKILRRCCSSVLTVTAEAILKIDLLLTVTLDLKQSKLFL